MASLNYDKVYSKFFTKAEAFDLIFEDLSEELMAEFMSSWLHSAVAYPYIRRLFTTVAMDDEEKVLDYTLRYQIDEFTDEEFVVEVLAYGIVHAWLEPKVRSITNIVQTFTSSEQKYYSQAAHLEEIRALLSDSEARIRSLISERGYMYNTYLDGGV